MPTGAKIIPFLIVKHFNLFISLCYFIILFPYILIFNLHCQLVLRISANTNMLHKNHDSK